MGMNINRRQALLGLGALGLAPGPIGSASAAERDKAAFMRLAVRETKTKETKNQCMTLKDREGNPRTVCKIITTRNSHVVPFGDWDYYYMAGPLTWEPNAGQSFEKVEVPRGFVTDLTSIPRAFWSLIPPTGRYAYAAIVHDYLYWFQPVTREAADQIFFAAMDDSKVSARTRDVIYGGVRAGGQKSWDANLRARQGGEKRILKEFPDDLLVSWDDWRKKPGVFAD